MGVLTASHMKNRADFLRAQRGVRWRSGALVLEVCRTPPVLCHNSGFRIGFTASRKVGGAVERNRAKRRLRALARDVLPTLAQEGTDYVLIAKTRTLTRPFALLRAELVAAIEKSHHILAETQEPGT